MILPTIKSEPKNLNARFLIYFGKVKSGKTTIASYLENNLIIDLENGTDFLSALVLKASNVTELAEIAKAIKAANDEKKGYVYDYITIDNGTKLQEMIMPLALQLYQNTPMGKNYNDDVRKLPKGAGYFYIREAFFKVVDMFKTLAPTIILICHAKVNIEDKNGKELSQMSMDLIGQLAGRIGVDADAIGYVYREKNKTFMNFCGGDNFDVEARQMHLRGQNILIAESDENNKITTYWDKIFLK